jgi:hypothetical protein
MLRYRFLYQTWTSNDTSYVCVVYTTTVVTWSQKYVSSAVTYNHITICLVLSTTAGWVCISYADWGYPCFSSDPPGNLPYSTLFYGSRDSSVIKVSGYRLDYGTIHVLSPTDANYFSCNICCRPPLGPNQTPAKWAPVSSSWGQIAAGCDAYHSPPSTEEIVNK